MPPESGGTQCGMVKMNKRQLMGVLSCLALIAPSGAALAQSAGSGVTEAELAVAENGFALQLVTSLQESGYTIVEVRKSLLGRVRVIAENDRHRREIVVSRTTGEIRRDALINANGLGPALERGGTRPGADASAEARSRNSASGGGNGRGSSGGKGGGGSKGGGNAGGGGKGGGNGNRK